jgi:N-acetylglucosaminyldiphosphoundecaprenol N-acetyl-beta-D-mannosaminyltransferase
MISKKNILGVGITDASKREILEYVIENVENFKKKLYLVTPNPEFLVLANKNFSFKNILNQADLASADGVGLMFAGKFLGKPLKERFTGVDIVENLCERVAVKPITVGFLGGRVGVAEKAAECLQKKYPGLKIAFVGGEWQEKRTSDKNSKLIDILFVAFGAPKQEFWISENLDKIPVKIAIGVGGAFDYISGKTPRAPVFMRNAGFEWLFRLIVQPWRIKRQLSLIEFIWLVFKEKFKGS